MAKKIKLTNDDDVFKGKGKDEIVNARAGDDSVSGGGGNDTLKGGAGNDVLKGGAGDDTLNGGADNDILLGGTGDDRLIVGKGDDTVDGGEGDDTVVLAGNFADATVTKDGDGYKIVTANGTTTVENVELFQFADGTVTEGDILGTDVGTTFTLKTGIDNVVGTAGNDVILGSVNTFVNGGTLETGDVIGGGDGTDTLKAIISNGIEVMPSVTGVEVLEVVDSVGGNINLFTSSGFTNFNVVASSAVTTLKNVAAIGGISVSNVAAGGGITVQYAAAAVAGATDTQKVSLTGSATAVAVAGGAITANGIETFDVAATGSNSVAALVSDKLTTVNVSGAGSFATTLAATTLKTYDASTATGAQTVAFTGVADVAVKGGAADDSFTFGATFTSKDTVDAGAGADTVSLAGGDYSVAGGDVLKGLVALKGVETLAFTGATGATIDNATLINAEVKTFLFDTTAADTVNNAVAANLYAFGGANTGLTTFNMKAGETTLNLELRGTATNDADADSITATGATLTTINVASKGLSTGAGGSGFADGDNAGNANNVNALGVVTATANATIKVTGDAHTSATMTNVGTFDATALTGDLWLWGSAGNDTLKGSAGVNDIRGLGGVDTIDISASAAKVDLVDVSVTAAAADRDSITGFKAGAGGDHLGLDAGKTTAATLVTAAPVVTSVASTAGAFLATTDVLEFEVSNLGTSLGDGSANSLNATNLDTLLDITAAANGTQGYVVAYQNGNAYIYHIDTGANAAVDAAGEAYLVAEIKSVAVGALTVDNFDLVV